MIKDIKLKTKKVGANLNVYNDEKKLGSIYWNWSEKKVVFEPCNYEDGIIFDENILRSIAEIIEKDKKNYWGGLLK